MAEESIVEPENAMDVKKEEKTSKEKAGEAGEKAAAAEENAACMATAAQEAAVALAAAEASTEGNAIQRRHLQRTMRTASKEADEKAAAAKAEADRATNEKEAAQKVVAAEEAAAAEAEVAAEKANAEKRAAAEKHIVAEDGLQLHEMHPDEFQGSLYEDPPEDEDRNENIPLGIFCVLLSYISLSRYGCPSDDLVIGKTSFCIKSFFKEFNDQLQGDVRGEGSLQMNLSWLRSLITDEICVSKSMHALKPNKMRRLFKFYAQGLQTGTYDPTGSQSATELSLIEFILLAKESNLIDEDLSMPRCFEIFMTGKPSMMKSIIEGKRYTNLHDEFELTFDDFLLCLVLMGASKAHNKDKSIPIYVHLEELRGVMNTICFENPHQELGLTLSN